MSHTVDCFFTPVSPWAYLGMSRFRRIAKATGADARFKPVDIMQIFASVGAVPLGQRPASKQENRLQELKRWRQFLAMPLNLNPAFFPTNPAPACQLIAASIARGSDGGALSEACLKACWAEEKDLSDNDTLIDLANQAGFNGSALLKLAQSPEIAAAVQRNTDEALARGVIGSPCYVIDDQVFFGQDRLDFVERALRHT